MQTLERCPDKGRPRADAQKIVVGYRLTGEARRDEAAIARALTTKGRFILATNDLDTVGYPDARLLADYKDQQGVERGFRLVLEGSVVHGRFHLPEIP